jgi:hypothetical protein
MVRGGILAPDRIGRQRRDTQKDYYRPAPHGGIQAYTAVTRKLCGLGNTRSTRWARFRLVRVLMGEPLRAARRRFQIRPLLCGSVTITLDLLREFMEHINGR